MFTKKLRILSLCIVLLITLSLFAACEEDTASGESDAQVASTTASATPTEVLSEISSDNLGSHDLGGITIKIGAASKDFLFPETTKTTIDEHKAEIVQSIAKRFNCVLEHVDIDYAAYESEVIPSLFAGDLVANIIMPSIVGAGFFVQANLCMDLNSPEISEYINFSNPWWDQTMAYASTINGATYCATPHFTSSVDTTFVIYFNKVIANDLGITDLYELEENYQWTWDKFREYAKMAVKDLNGDGEMTLEEDRWGFLACPYDSMCSFLTGAGCRTIEVDPITKKATFALNQAKNIEIMTTLNEIYTSDGIYTHTDAVTSMDTYFVNGKSLFSSYHLSYLKKDCMREMSDDFGVLLMPLGPNQTKYMSRADHNTSCVIIPTTNNDPEELKATAIVLEGLAFATWKQGVPDIIDLYGVQYTRDDGSDWAIKHIFDCTTYETSQLLYMMGSPIMWTTLVESMLQDQICNTKGADISGKVASIETAAQQFIDDLWKDKYEE